MPSIPSFPAYEINEDGEVARKGRLLKPTDNGKGYQRVFLRRDGRTHTCYVHRLVCEVFHGEPAPEAEVRHLNGIPSDNRAANLCWGNRVENMADMEAHGNLRWGERASGATLSAKTVLAMRDMVRSGALMQDAAAAYGVPDKVAADAISGRKWRRLPGAIEPKSTQRRLSPDDVRRIRELAGAVPQTKIAERFGVTRGAVQQVLYGQTYRHVR